MAMVDGDLTLASAREAGIQASPEEIRLPLGRFVKDAGGRDCVTIWRDHGG